MVAILTESENPRKYWSVLKNRLKKEGSQLATNCSQLKMQSADGKFYKTDVADTEQLLRLIQSVPSPKAEPFKMWLAKVVYERIEEYEYDYELKIYKSWLEDDYVVFNIYNMDKKKYRKRYPSHKKKSYIYNYFTSSGGFVNDEK